MWYVCVCVCVYGMGALATDIEEVYDKGWHVTGTINMASYAYSGS